MERNPAVYIMASGFHGTLYTGVTSDLLKRVAQHREGIFAGFSSHYGCNRLVWFEMHATMEGAIVREKCVKRWRRAWKLTLVEAGNPAWRDLAEDFGFHSLVGGELAPNSGFSSVTGSHQ